MQDQKFDFHPEDFDPAIFALYIYFQDQAEEAICTLLTRKEQKTEGAKEGVLQEGHICHQVKKIPSWIFHIFSKIRDKMYKLAGTRHLSASLQAINKPKELSQLVTSTFVQFQAIGAWPPPNERIGEPRSPRQSLTVELRLVLAKLFQELEGVFQKSPTPDIGTLLDTIQQVSQAQYSEVAALRKIFEHPLEDMESKSDVSALTRVGELSSSLKEQYHAAFQEALGVVKNADGSFSFRDKGFCAREQDIEYLVDHFSEWCQGEMKKEFQHYPLMAQLLLYQKLNTPDRHFVRAMMRESIEKKAYSPEDLENFTLYLQFYQDNPNNRYSKEFQELDALPL
jgi:hypothetical protein